MFRLNTIRDNKGARKKPKILGRGIGSGLGKTSGRGGKGQTARSGVAINGFEGGQNPIYRRLPKRGFKNIHRIPTYELTLEKLDEYLTSGKLAKDAVVDLGSLLGARLARSRHKAVSVFGEGELNHKVNIVVDRISATAKAIIEKAGGTVTLVSVESK